MATIRRRGDKYQVQIRRLGFPSLSRTFHNRSDAHEWSRHMEARADRGELPIPMRERSRYTVRSIVERYRNEVSIKKKSYNTEVYILNSFLRQSIANHTLAEITPAHFADYREMRLREVRPVTVNRELYILKHAFDVAIRDWDLPLRENPLGKLKKLKVQNARMLQVLSRLDKFKPLYQTVRYMFHCQDGFLGPFYFTIPQINPLKYLAFKFFR